MLRHLTTLEVKYAQNKEKVGPFMDEARDVRERSDNLVNYITQLKAHCMAVSEGKYDDAVANDFVNFIGQDETGMDTTINLGLDSEERRVPGTDCIHGGFGTSESLCLTRMTNGVPPLQKPGSYRDYLKGVKLIDSQGQTRELPEYITVQLDERFTFENEMEDGKEVLWESRQLLRCAPCSSHAIDVQDDCRRARRTRRRVVLVARRH